MMKADNQITVTHSEEFNISNSNVEETKIGAILSPDLTEPANTNLREE